MSTKTRPWAIGTVVVFTALAAACGSSAKTTGTSTSIAPTTSSTSVAPPTTALEPAESIAVWPTAAGSTRYHDPVVAVRAFATDYLHMVNPVVGSFRQGDARSGEVEIRPKATGPATTVFARQLGNDSSWWVLGSSTSNIGLTEPAALAAITSPVRLRGTSTAFEATVNVSIRQDGSSTPLAETYVMGGANGQMGPFDASVKFVTPTSRSGAIVMYTVSSETGHVAEATVLRVRFAGN